MHPEAEKFLIRVKRAMCAGEEGKTGSSLPGSRSWKYADGEFDYMDTCFGTEQFTRQEVLWEKKTPIWAANYVGRILGKDFPADFFREALLAGCCRFPYRGAEQYEKGGWIYKCAAKGDPDWFYGYEEILYRDLLMYECAFHGGQLR